MLRGVGGMEESESFGGGEDWKSTQQLVCFRAATELQVKSGYCSSREV